MIFNKTVFFERFKFSVILTIFITFFSLSFQSCGTEKSQPEQEKKEVSPPSESDAEPSPPYHPKSIEALREREYSAGTIKLVREIPSKPGLKTAVLSYDSDGYTQYLLVEKPAGKAPEKGWPILLMLHGYIPPDYYSTENSYRSISEVYAAAGFVVVKPDYRGHDQSESPAEESVTRTIDFSEDVLNLLAGIDQINDGDFNNIFLFGHSMGGEIALRVLAVNPYSVKRAIRGATFWAAVTEDFPENTLYFLRKREDPRTDLYEKVLAQTVPEDQYKELSPGYYLEGTKVPLIIHHGNNDKVVPFEWSVSFRDTLKKAGIDFIFHEYPGDDHNIIANRPLVIQRDINFFLKNQK